MEKEILHLKNQHIDREKWDHCIANAVNGYVYAFSWYMDIISDGWEALVLGDYEYVMPLPTDNKLIFHHISCSSLCPHLGVFPSPADVRIAENFIEAIPQKYKVINYSLNIYNKPGSPRNYTLTEKDIFQLDLILPYDEIAEKFNLITHTQIASAIAEKTTIIQGVTPAEYLKFKQQYTKSEPMPDFYSKLHGIITHSINKGIGKILGAYTKHNNLCAAAFFIRSHNTVILLDSFSSEEGLKTHAMSLLISHFLKKHSGQPLTLNFEGSQTNEATEVYKGFGATPSTYCLLRRNNNLTSLFQ